MNYRFLNCNWLIDRNRYRKLLEQKFNEFFQIECFHKTEFVVLLMTVLCKFVSVEEFVIYFRMHPSQVNNIFKNLKDKSFVEPIKITNKSISRVSRTDTLYTYTKAGFEAIINYPEIGPRIFNPYKFVKENSKNLHDYVNGMNLFAAISSIEPFFLDSVFWVREPTYGDIKRADKTLSIDAGLNYKKGKTVLIETDLNNESNWILINKLEKYCKYPNKMHPFLSMENNQYVIVFSCFFPIRMDEYAFIQKNIRDIISNMKDFPEDYLLSDYYDLVGKHLGTDLEKTLREILDTPMGIASKDRKMREKLTVGDFRSMGTRFAIENPFYLNGFNRYQYLKFREKKKKLTDEFGGYRSNDYDYLHSATHGGQAIYAVPTVLLGNYIAYITDFNHYRNKIASCLEKYFGAINFNDYMEHASYTAKKIGVNTLRNLFHSKKGVIGVEYYSIDITSIFRIDAFHESEEYTEFPIHLIVIVDEIQDAYDVSMQIRDFNRHKQYILKEGQAYLNEEMDKCDILYLLKSDLEKGKKDALFFYSGYKTYVDEDGKLARKTNEYHKLVPKVLWN